MLTEEDWNEVLNTLSECPLFIGIYDAKHSNERYMYGIGTVMESIAAKAGREEWFSDFFYENMISSKKYSNDWKVE